MLRSGGRIAFLTIQPTPGLSARQRRRAHLIGPAAVAVPTSYPSLLASAGFVEVDTVDVTGDYLATQLSWIESLAAREEAMREVMGHDPYDERMRERHRAVQATRDGLLSRFMYSATRR